MNKRTIYKDQCPEGGFVRPSICARCPHVAGQITIRLMNEEKGNSIYCTKDSRVETIVHHSEGAAGDAPNTKGGRVEAIINRGEAKTAEEARTLNLI